VARDFNIPLDSGRVERAAENGIIARVGTEAMRDTALAVANKGI
jgi:hypothetical protein